MSDAKIPFSRCRWRRFKKRKKKILTLARQCKQFLHTVYFTLDTTIINPEITNSSRYKISNGLDQKSKASSAKLILSTRIETRQTMCLRRRDAERWIKWMIIIRRYRLDVLRKDRLASMHILRMYFPLMNNKYKKRPCNALQRYT